MIIRSLPSVRPSEITPRSAYFSRRAVLAGIAGAGLVAAMPTHASGASLTLSGSTGPAIDEPKTSREDIAAYNNFYEFGVGKDDPANYAGEMTTEPWTIKVDGLVAKPADYQLEDFVKPFALEERIYRMRCVEGWSMVIPWNGFPLADILKRAEPEAAAKFVAFETLVRPKEMRGQRGYFQALAWPYREGLRLDEAMHPLTILAVGLYGETLPNQNGAPLRLVVPWKYGFKGIKSIVRISLVAEQPATSWNLQNPGEYGFYSNVNPLVDHPRWSQATERRIGDGGIFAARRPTLPFNGYAEEVASLYAGMDLKANF